MSEFDPDRFISVRASVIHDGEARIRELEAELAGEKNLNRQMYDAEAHLQSLIADLRGENYRLRDCLKRQEVELKAELAKLKICDMHKQFEPLRCPVCMDAERSAENAHLRECLKRLEWIKLPWVGMEKQRRCPVCWGIPEEEGGDGHDPTDCWLAAELREK